MLDQIVEAFQSVQPYLMPALGQDCSFQDLLFTYITKVEYNLLDLNDMNLNAPNGYDLVAGLLNTCNESYDFEPILAQVSSLALQSIFIFRDHPHDWFTLDTDHDKLFKVSVPRQSEVFIASLKAYCECQDWQAFFADFISSVSEDFQPPDCTAIAEIARKIHNDQIGFLATFPENPGMPS